MPLIDPRTGESLFPVAPAGFYLVNQCPICNAPLFYHGGGRHTEYSVIGPAQVHSVPEQVFQWCDCEIPGEIEIALPKEYNLLIERETIHTLFTLIARLTISHRAALEALQELLLERENTIDVTDLSEATIEDTSGTTIGE